jgi:hypothetical protein
LDGGVEGTPWHLLFIVATVVVIGTIFVSAHGTTAARTMAAATDKAIMPISAARKRWDTTDPSA